MKKVGEGPADFVSDSAAKAASGNDHESPAGEFCSGGRRCNAIKGSYRQRDSAGKFPRGKLLVKCMG
jgi:hypothetical protein